MSDEDPVVICPQCWVVINLMERCKHGITLEDFRFEEGWLVPCHHEPGTSILCDGTNIKVEAAT